MNVALIFAGGTGQRMYSTTIPKQFLELYGKPIIVYTIEEFQKHSCVDGIIVVCVKEWIDYCEELVSKYRLYKVAAVVPGGNTGQASIRMGLTKAKEIYKGSDIILIHDGVRPLIDEKTITNVILCAQKNGSAITVSPAIETIVLGDNNGKIKQVMQRSACKLAKAPQAFRLYDLLIAHKKAVEEGFDDFIDSASLMSHYGYILYTVEGTAENIKITTPADYYIFRAIKDARENRQVFG